MDTTTRIWWIVAALLVVVGGWIGFNRWQDTNNEADRQTDRLTCAMTGDDC